MLVGGLELDSIYEPARKLGEENSLQGRVFGRRQ